jgi:hypothetical protein
MDPLVHHLDQLSQLTRRPTVRAPDQADPLHVI